MIDPKSQVQLRQEVTERMVADRALLDKLRLKVARLRPQVRRIRERNTASISLVGTDGGNNPLFFDPFLVRSNLPSGDSSNNEYVLEAVIRPPVFRAQHTAV